MTEIMATNNLTITPQALWNKILDSVQPRVEPRVFESWFKPLELIQIENNTMTLQVPNLYFKNRIAKVYAPLIKAELLRAGYPAIELSLVISLSYEEQKKQMDSFFPAVRPSKISLGDKEIQLRSSKDKEGSAFKPNPKYTFENFVVGDSNRYAHAACLAVAESPAKSYNPLVIYGGVGLGKTHLLHAIVRRMQEQNSSARINYITTEQFLNEYVNGIRFNRMENFREKFRKTDILLIDDIQFLENKEGLQEELFHTFNTLFDSHRQIVCTADRPVREIKIAERLQSRFSMGLSADIQPPDYETRLAILKKIAQREYYYLTVPEEVYIYIASKFKHNVRLLEGSLNRIVAMSDLLKKELSLPLAEAALKDMVPPEQKSVSVDDIKKAVSSHFSLAPGELENNRRTSHVVLPRQIAMYLVRELTNLSLPDTGSYFGGRDHTTVMYAIKQVMKKIEADPSFNQLMQNLTKSLGANR